jgi:hypothetical protein
MKYLLATILVLVLAATSAGILSYRMSCEPTLHAAATSGDAMAWLRTDFHLTDRQFSAIRQLHESYLGTCEEHCRLIQEATKVRDALKTAKAADPAEAAAAERKVQELRVTCETAITRHVRQVAAVMSPADGERYLTLVLPKIADFDHTVAPDLHLNHPH